MKDRDIVALYWQRDQGAIRHTQEKYHPYLMKIARGILGSEEDSQESVNDTYFKAWNAMPPHRPTVLSTFLGKITRQVSIDLWRRRNSWKRQGTEYALCLDELTQCTVSDPQEEVDAQLLAQTINRFVSQLSPQARALFVGRYFYCDSLKEVASYCHMSQGKAKSILFRTRNRLRNYLIEEGFQP